jgi:glycine/D-amino acid oxidase-like deaminating enzyme
MKQLTDTTPHWIESAPMPGFPTLSRDERADVVVVGAGITGLTAAYLLTRAGRSVVVLERDRGPQAPGIGLAARAGLPCTSPSPPLTRAHRRRATAPGNPAA